jgi:putative phosphoesterase
LKIGVISDTHIPIRAKKIPEKVFEHFKGVELILHAGDLIDLSVLDELRQITPKVEAVSGNMDASENSASLPRKKLLNINGVKIGLIHGWGAPSELKTKIFDIFSNEKPNVIVFGHSHQPEKTIFKDILFLNPGSPTDKVFASVNSVAVLNVEDGKFDAEIIML